MVVVKLDPRLYDTFIPPAERALKGRRGRRARAAPKRGAEREAQDLVWRVAEVRQVIPPTPDEEMALHVHLYDTYDHHLDVASRAYHPAYRDTRADKDVYDSVFRGALAKPDHFIEFCDTLKASQLLTRPFTLRKDGRLPNDVVEQLDFHPTAMFACSIFLIFVFGSVFLFVVGIFFFLVLHGGGVGTFPYCHLVTLGGLPPF